MSEYVRVSAYSVIRLQPLSTICMLNLSNLSNSSLGVSCERASVKPKTERLSVKDNNNYVYISISKAVLDLWPLVRLGTHRILPNSNPQQAIPCCRPSCRHDL